MSNRKWDPKRDRWDPEKAAQRLLEILRELNNEQG